MAAALSEPRDAIEDIIEPFLIQCGYLQRTPRGRLLTSHAFRHLGLAEPARDPAQFGLFGDGGEEEVGMRNQHRMMLYVVPYRGWTMPMRTTLAIDDDLLAKAQEYTGLQEKSALVREALEGAGVERESRSSTWRRLRWHRTEELRPVPRRRSR